MSTGDPEGLAARVDQLETDLATTAEQVGALTTQLRRLLAVRGQQPWWWPDLNPAAAEAAWTRLAAWVNDCLLARFPAYARELLPCWRLHPDIVDELTALRTLWYDAYANPQARPAAAADYRGRYVPAAMDRVRESFSLADCSRGVASQHGHNTSEPLPGWDDARVAEFLAEDLAHRDT